MGVSGVEGQRHVEYTRHDDFFAKNPRELTIRLTLASRPLR
jgi:hypothetical protein